MFPKVSVEDILQRVPERARAAYTNLVTHPRTRYDDSTGWSYAYLTQDDLASLMNCGLRTVTRALADLRRVGVVRVLPWPGAETETHIRIADIDISSPFGPMRVLQEQQSHHAHVTEAIHYLTRQWEAERRLFDVPEVDESTTGASTGASTDTPQAHTRTPSTSPSNKREP